MFWHRLDETWVEQVAALEHSIAVSPWSAEMLREEMRLGSWQQVVLAGTLQDARLAGYIVARPQLDEWHLMTLGVAPAFRRQGVGRRLLQGVMDAACRCHARCLLLEVRISNHAACKLYLELGFKILSVRRGYYPKGPMGPEDALVMALEWPAGARLSNP
ncbi:MAG: ribosomal protein S18-alanine N-acetyltransferase [Magnetococcus sp. YQC-5]